MTPRPTQQGAAILVAAFFAFASTASAAPATSTPASPPPAPADAKQPQTPGEPAPADPLATPSDDGAPSDTPPAPATTKKPSEPQLSEADTLVARAGLDIDTAEAGPSGPIIVSRMEELGNLELRRAEILPSRLGTDPVIRIRVSLQPGASDVFLIRSDVAIRGEAVEGSVHDVSCSLCTESEVVERARGEIVRLVPFVRSLFKKPDEPKPPDPKPEGPKPGPAPLANMGKAGIGLLAGGTLATAAGLGLSLAEEPADANMPLNKITIHPAGYAILAVGVAALVTGTVLLVLDRRKAKRNLQIAPTAGAGSTGLVLLGRF
jgi:hypothetical protein